MIRKFEFLSIGSDVVGDFISDPPAVEPVVKNTPKGIANLVK